MSLGSLTRLPSSSWSVGIYYLWIPENILITTTQVDSVNGTFYELMNISINATTKEIKKEYKKQAMVIHPDKNPETEEQFKQLAAVYNILKDDRTRAMYHRVSINPFLNCLFKKGRFNLLPKC